MKKVTIQTNELGFAASVTFPEPDKSLINSMLGGRHIVREPELYSGPTESMEYFAGVLRMHGYTVEFGTGLSA